MPEKAERPASIPSYVTSTQIVLLTLLLYSSYTGDCIWTSLISAHLIATDRLTPASPLSQAHGGRRIFGVPRDTLLTRMMINRHNALS